MTAVTESEAREIADKVVALGVGESTLGDRGWLYRLDDDHIWLFEDTAETFLNDWRVAGALFEKCGGIYAHCEPHIDGWWCYVESNKAVKMPLKNFTVENESLPRAIIEACCEALDRDSTHDRADKAADSADIPTQDSDSTQQEPVMGSQFSDDYEPEVPDRD